LNGLGNIAVICGDYARGRSLFEESLALMREMGDRHGVATALSNLGHVVGLLGEHAMAQAHHEESLALFRELGDQAGTAATLVRLGHIGNFQGALDAARASFEASLAISRKLENRIWIAYALSGLGWNATLRGDDAGAHGRHAEALGIHRDLGNLAGIAMELDGIAIATCEGALRARVTGLATKNRWDLERAIRLFGAEEAAREAAGACPLADRLRIRLDRCIVPAREALGDAVFAAAWAEGRRMTIEEACAYALQFGAALPRAAG
jgi:tetratricopeptide (TPR) repeat protein